MKIEERTFLFPNGERAIIRSAGPEDALLVKTHRETTASETHFMAREPEDGQMNLQRITVILDEVEKSERDFMVGCHKDNFGAARFYEKHGFIRSEYSEGNDIYYLRYEAELKR